MAEFTLSYSGTQINNLLGAVNTAVNGDGIVSTSGLNTILEDYLTSTTAANLYQPLILNTTDLTAGSLTVRPSSGEAIIYAADGTHYSDNTFAIMLDLNPSSGNHGIWSTGYMSSGTFTNDPKWMLYRDGSGNIVFNGTANNVARASFGNRDYCSHDCNAITSNGMWYYGSNGPATSIGATTTDGSLYSQAYSDVWVSQIAQDYRNGNLFVRGKNNGTWTTWNKIRLEGGYGGTRGTASYTFDASNTSRTLSVTFTTHGRPVFLAASGDLNPTTADNAWLTIDLYLDSTQLCRQIAESHGNSWNIPFHCSYLASCSAGSHTFKVVFTRGAGTFTLSEGGAVQAPNFSAFEI